MEFLSRNSATVALLAACSFTAPGEALAFLGNVADVDLASTLPRLVRGNHDHGLRREAIVVLPASPWSVHWDGGEGAAAQSGGVDGTSGNRASGFVARRVQRRRVCVMAGRIFLGKLRPHGNSLEKGRVGLSAPSLSGLCGAPSKSWLARDPAWV